MTFDFSCARRGKFGFRYSQSLIFDSQLPLPAILPDTLCYLLY